MGDDEYARLNTQAIRAAVEDLLNGSLFIPAALVRQCEAFVKAVQMGRNTFAIAHDRLMEPRKRAELWAAAARVAYEDLPKLLAQIEEAGRTLIHGQPPEA